VWRRHNKNFKRTKTKKSYKKRKATKKSAGIGRGIMGNHPMALVINKGLGYPAKTRVKLRYQDLIGLTSTTGALSYYVFGCNCAYDPNITGTGHQPMYFDQYMAVYDHYKVLGSKIQIRAIPAPAGTTTPNAFRSTVVVNDDATLTGVTDFGQLIEWGMLDKFLVLGGAEAQLGQKMMYATWSCKKFFKDKYQSDQLSGDVSNNPVETSCYIICQQPINSDTITVNYQVTIDFIVDFYELKDIAQS